MARYKSRRQYHSRLEKQENKKLRRQTLIIFVLTISLIVLLIFVGIPFLSRMAIFVGGIGTDETTTTQSDELPPQTPQLSSPPEATNSSSLNLTGFSESGATVTLFQNNQEKIKTIVDANGKFEFIKIDLEQGKNTFYAIAKDIAENTSQRSLTRIVNYDTQAPEISISEPEDGSQIVGVTKQTVTIIGTTEPGSKIMLNGRVVVVKSDGSFNTKHSLQDGENTLTFTSSDKAGNTTSQDLKLNFASD